MLIKKQCVVTELVIRFVGVIAIVLATGIIALEDFSGEDSAVLRRFVLVHDSVDRLDGHVLVCMHLLEPVVRLVVNEQHYVNIALLCDLYTLAQDVLGPAPLGDL